MALNDIALCARALIRLGASPITSFDDQTVEAEIAGALYAPVRDALLSAYPWSFATGKIALTQDSQAPVADYQYAYNMPNDFLRAISAGGAQEGQGTHYKIVRNKIHSNANALTLTYIFRPDESEFPPFFDIALINRLAAEFCIPVTESTSRSEALYRLAEREYEKARQIDAQQDSPNAIQDFTLIDVR